MHIGAIRYLGLGYYQAWVFVVVMSLRVVDPGADVLFGETNLRMLLSGSISVCLVAAMFFEHVIDVLNSGRWVLCLAGCSVSVGTLLFIQALTIYCSAPLCLFSILLVSSGNAVLLLAWIDYLSKKRQDEQLRFLLVAWPFAAVVECVSSLLPLTVVQLLGVLLPLGAALTLILCNGAKEQEHPYPTDLGIPRLWRRSLTRVLVACLTVSVAFGVARTLPPFTMVMRDAPFIYLGIAVIFGMLIAVSHRVAKTTHVSVVLYRFCFPALIVCYLVLPFAPAPLFDAVVALLLSASFVFEMLIWFVCPLIVVERGLSTLYVFGWGATAFHVGSFVGLLAGDLLATFADTEALVSPLCVAIGAVLVLVMAYVFKEQGVVELFAPNPPVCETEVSAIAETCRSLTERHGLSARESQILDLLARGRSVPYIERELGITTSTAKTHVRHIYQKIGVHTKQELLDLLPVGANMHKVVSAERVDENETKSAE